jgi:outer membrane murein-binding lipoprotein Lpp
MKINLKYVLAAIVVIAVFFIVVGGTIYTNKVNKLSKAKLALEHKVEAYQRSVDSLNTVIINYETTISELSNQDNIINYNYNDKINSFRDATIVSNDSITKYISSKIKGKK